MSFTFTPSFTIDRTLVMNQFSSLTQANAGLQATITNSVFVDAGFGFSFNTPVNGALVKVDVDYNTFFNQTRTGQVLTCSTNIPATCITYKNNIFSSPMTTTTQGSVFMDSTHNGCMLDTNIEYPQTSGVGTNVKPYDPMFVDPTNLDLHLKAGSPAIGQATVIPNQPTVDYDGTPRPQGTGYDIGAFEYH